ncbi:hypothetical protein TRFO_18934 [Tritrichomonas foetus]|uniref:Uncharacterized protein n=1 Tax=Tritrichomonas foetus TaxID=1144522 RepID=A0A1J4KQ67_9EUKA|nr:hypothetical protein TRFO_18934 [Tritrichomonas foetus]|eukprot:OHT11573.1 hypothetical protein TRFO_18934 [Tritrichomonas foetus]
MEYIAEEYSKDLEMCTLRQVPDSEILKKEAQIQAKFGNYDAAEELFAMSTSTREMTLQQRQENVHNFYERLQEHVEQRHADELALNDEKRMKEFNDIKIHYNKEIERMRKVLANSSMKLQVEQNFEEEDEIFKELIIDVEDENEMPKMEPSPKSSPKAVTPTKLSPRPSLSPKPTLPPKSPKPAISPKPAASPRSLVSRTLASARQKAAAKSPKSQMSPAAKRKTAPPASPSQ